MKSATRNIKLNKNFSLKIPENISAAFFVLIPFLLVYGGTVFQTTHKEITTISKILSFLYMICYVGLQKRLPRQLFYGTLVFIPLLIYGIFNSWLLKAGISDGIRYLFPIVVLFYSYAIKEYFPLLLDFVILFVIINFLVQIINYINWVRGVDQWFYYTTSAGNRYYNSTAGIIRATGTVVFFGFFGFMNMIAFFIIKFYYHGKFKTSLLGICLLMLLASFSYKAFGPFLVILLIYYYKNLWKFVTGLIIGGIILFLTFPERVTAFVDNLVLRIQLYITQGNSARAESYRVMWNEIFNGNWFGRGVGTFGGPASIEYNSWYYNLVGFNWYDAKWLQLTTTDTYPPHAFVELGIIGGAVYFILLMTPLFQKYWTKSFLIVLAIYFCLFFDMLFSFSLNNLDYLMFSLAFVYPILHYKEKQNQILASSYEEK